MKSSKKKSNAATSTSRSTSTSLTAVALRVAVVVALAAWAAWNVEPLLSAEHVVARHNHQLSPYHIRNAQGLWLHHYAWMPSSSPVKGVMFYSHGFGDHCGRYHEFAELWTNNSFAFFCLDHQGHGQSEGERAYVESFNDYIIDYSQFIDGVLYNHPQLKDLPRFLAGTSMGGTIATLVANERPSFFNGVVLLAPAIIPDPRSAAPWQATTRRMLGRLPPHVAPLSYRHWRLAKDATWTSQLDIMHLVGRPVEPWWPATWRWPGGGRRLSTRARAAPWRA